MDIDITQALKDTENALRDFISSVLRKKFGENWVEKCGVSPERIKKWNERVEASKKIVLGTGKVTVTELTPEAWQGFVDAAQPLYAKYGAKHKALLDEIRAGQQ